MISKGRFLNILRRAAVVVAISLTLFSVVFYYQQGVLIFQTERELTRDPSALGWAFEDVSLPVMGETTHGWFMPLESARGVVLFCHGNGGNVAMHLDGTRLFRALGYSTLTFDYGGYGRSTGRPSETRMYADSLAMWTYVTETRRIPANHIIIWGQSFGGAAACDLGARVQPAAVVLESTFLSMADCVFGERWALPGDWLLRYHFRNVDKVGRIHAPLLVIHSPDDTLFPIRHGRGLYERANDPKRFIEKRGDHYDTAIPNKRLPEDVKKFLEPLLVDAAEAS
ncbi:MAG: alpha/beta hydrolase [Candidatus Hydrogenedentes bacterium]|nr:alpha/beta hydrolase [Candidatus Hydrogenedentota bacterium]